MPKEAIGDHAEEWERAQQFLREAVAEGAHKLVPPGYNPKWWVAATNVIGVYAWTKATFANIAHLHQVDQQVIHQTYHRGTHALWSQVSPELRERYPWESLKFSKPRNESWSDNLSIAGGGISVGIKALASEGLSAKELRLRLNISGKQLSSARKTLRGVVQIPYDVMTAAEYRNLWERLASPDLTDQEVKMEMSKVKRAFLANQQQKNDPVVLPIRKLLSDMGLCAVNPNIGFSAVREISETLEVEGLPIQKISYEIKSGPQKGAVDYYLYWRYHRSRAMNIIQKLLIS